MRIKCGDLIIMCQWVKRVGKNLIFKTYSEDVQFYYTEYLSENSAKINFENLWAASYLEVKFLKRVNYNNSTRYLNNEYYDY